MKNIFKLLFLSSLLATTIVSCKKDDVKDYFNGGTPPVLSVQTNTSSSSSVSLVYADAAKTALTLSWTNPNYQFTTGISSQDVQYTVEIDTAGSNFTNPNKKQIVVSKDLKLTILESELNDYLLNQLALQPSMPHSLEFRVTSGLSGNTVPLTSNVAALIATPYTIPPKVAPPTAGTLWIVGSAVASGWSNPLPSPYDNNQEFTKISNTLYELVVPLIPGGGYKLIQTQGVWGTQYHALDGTADLSGDFEQKDSDPQFPAPAVAGTYKISVDFQRGKYTLTKQ